MLLKYFGGLGTGEESWARMFKQYWGGKEIILKNILLLFIFKLHFYCLRISYIRIMYFIRCWLPTLPLQLTPFPDCFFLLTSSALFCSTLSQHGVCLCVQRELQDHQLKSRNPLPDHILEENGFLLDRQPAIANSSSVRGKASWDSSTHAGILADLAWCRS